MQPNPDSWDPRRSEPPAEGFELFRHKNADTMRTQGWHGYFWARQTPAGDYELRSVPASLGEPSMPAGSAPREPFERLYARSDRV